MCPAVYECMCTARHEYWYAFRIFAVNEDKKIIQKAE